jgi:hypothetical protein
MTTNQISGAEVWGAPQQPPRRWSLRETAAAVAVAAVIAALGGAAVYAATESSSRSFGASHQAFGPGSAMPSGPGGQHGPAGAPGPVALEATSLHGEFVVPGAGGYTTVLTQTGMVTAISPTSITVRSADGYSQTYVVPTEAGKASPPLGVDDQVVVRATLSGQTATVTEIGNPTGLGGPSGPHGPRPHRN